MGTLTYPPVKPSEPSTRFVLRDLSLPSRLVIAVFLLTVGLGYLAALLQLRIQHASSGEALPSEQDTIAAFSGVEGKCTLERILEAPPTKAFNGSGQMSAVFLEPAKASGWAASVKKTAKDMQAQIEEKENRKLSDDEVAKLKGKAEEKVRQLRNGERLALLDWIRSSYTSLDGARDSYKKNAYVPTPALAASLKLDADEPLVTDNFVDKNAAGQSFIKVHSLIETRCTRCHAESKAGPEAAYPLEDFDQVAVYLPREKSGGMSLPKLTQSTHVHLLGFSMLWALTGLAFACTRYWGWVRAIFGPWTLVAQIADIGCWWLAWKYPQAAVAIRYTGMLVGVGLAVQIVGTLFDLFGWTGKVMLGLVLAAGILGLGVFYGEVVQPRLQKEQDVLGAVAAPEATH